MTSTALIRCPGCSAVNRVPKEKIHKGLTPVCGRCKASLPTNQPVTVNDAKRVLLQAAAFNLALILRSITTTGTPKGLADLKRKVVLALLRVLAALWALPAPIFGVYETSAIRSSLSDRVRPNPPKLRPSGKSRF